MRDEGLGKEPIIHTLRYIREPKVFVREAFVTALKFLTMPITQAFKWDTQWHQKILRTPFTVL